MKSRIRLMTVLGAFSLVAGLMVPFAPQALANHGNYLLEVSPDISEQTTNTGSKTLTAQLHCAQEPCPADPTLLITPINIDFEASGVNDSDNSSALTSPDKSCNIDGTNDVDDPTTDDRNESLTCSVTFSGTTQGTMLVRAWIDHDKVQGNFDGDSGEGRYAGATDCGTAAQDGATCATGTPVPGGAPTNPPAQCPGAQVSGQEPDCTDVVEIDFVANTSQNRVDCDDNGAPDTEIENKQGTGAGSDVSYTCLVTDNGGNPLANVQVNGENEDGINDPDPDDDASYSDPDYGCSTNANGSCSVVVSASESEVGTANICWYTNATQAPVRCAEEIVSESQNAATGADTANDGEDKTQINWSDPAQASNLDCAPETATNPTDTTHTITCTAKNGQGQVVPLVPIDVEITGAGDPDFSDTPLLNPDTGCVTENSGSCSFTHTSSAEGDTTYRAWLDVDDDDTTDESDGDETQTPDDTDDTDVVTKTWVPAPDSITITPESDSAEVGACNPYTITAEAGTDPAAGAKVDVEQRHEDAGTTGEPSVSYCTPSTGPNASGVTTSAGDLGPSSAAADKEDPDQAGTAGGETTLATDANGQVTIGIRVTASGTNDGSGTVNLVAFWDPNDNHDPDVTEPQGEASKTWAPAAGTGGRSIDCEPETQTVTTDQNASVTCTVRDADNAAQAGVDVSFTEEGPGTFASSSQGTTNPQGQVTVQVTSEEGGDQEVTGTITNSTQNETDTDECDRGADDPPGSSQGVCSDTVTVTWQAVEQPECSDGEDNDGDGQIDFPADDGCDSAADDDEGGLTCPGYENSNKNQLVGTEGDDTLTGTSGPDIICGLGGNDQLIGLGGDDLLIGGSGDDSLQGDAGNDTANGGAGDDVIQGAGGKDKLKGNGGKDVIKGGGDNDNISGGSGNDRLSGGGGNDNIKGGGGNDRINGGPGKDTCHGGPGKDKLKKCEKGDDRRR